MSCNSPKSCVTPESASNSSALFSVYAQLFADHLNELPFIELSIRTTRSASTRATPRNTRPRSANSASKSCGGKFAICGQTRTISARASSRRASPRRTTSQASTTFATSPLSWTKRAIASPRKIACALRPSLRPASDGAARRGDPSRRHRRHHGRPDLLCLHPSRPRRVASRAFADFRRGRHPTGGNHVPRLRPVALARRAHLCPGS